MTRAKKTTSFSASVIIPAYNAEKHLGACLDALLGQTVKADEIIVVDDGSSDKTKIIAESYSLVTLISQKNQGPARARNEGAKRAESEIIIFLDSDCVPEKDWLEEMLKPFDDEDVVGVQGAYRTHQTSFVAKFDQLDIEYRYERMKRAKKLDWIGTYAAAYNRKLFLSEGGFDESFPRASGEDAELSYRLAEKGKLLAFAPNAIVYHTHPATLWKYLNVKFFRAYWRMRMYVKHPKKAINDSYTPQELKVGIPLGIISGVLSTSLILIYGAELFYLAKSPNVGTILILISSIMLGLLFGGMMILLFSPRLMKQLGAAPFAMKLFAPFILCLRAIAFGLGMFFGLLDRRVRA